MSDMLMMKKKVGGVGFYSQQGFRVYSIFSGEKSCLDLNLNQILNI